MSKPSSEAPKPLPSNLQLRLARIEELGLAVTAHLFKNKRQAITLAHKEGDKNGFEKLIAFGNFPSWEYVVREV